MTKQNQVYECSVCGNVVEVLHEAKGTLSCCGQPMNLLEENTKDAAVEKHVPVVEKIEGGYKVTVGEVNHPMQDEHLIEWIELVTEDTVLRKYLKPGDAPQAIFYTDAENVFAREYCNLHGHWRSK
ncbi:desulfoferrodoxin [Bacteroidales bacterium]|nr:desulfoferrodoxin [Bacteroidales bacterium]